MSTSDIEEARRLAKELTVWARDYATTDYTDEMASKSAVSLLFLADEVERLRGLKPEIPPLPPHNNDASYQHHALPRYGLRWNGPGQPVSVPMADGYWTPFHLALEAAA